MFCFAKFCRLCLKDSIDLINIFYTDKDNEKIVDKINFLCPELISPLDGFSRWVCVSCRKEVNRSFNLFKKWIKSHETLQKYKRKFSITNQVPIRTILHVELVGNNCKLDKIEKSVNICSKIVSAMESKSNELVDGDINQILTSVDKVTKSCNNVNNELEDVQNTEIKSDEDNKSNIIDNNVLRELQDLQISVQSNIAIKNDNEDKQFQVPEIQYGDNKTEETELYFNKTNDNNIAIMGTENKVLEELLEIVKITENIQKEQLDILDQLPENTKNKDVKNNQLLGNITQDYFHLDTQIQIINQEKKENIEITQTVHTNNCNAFVSNPNDFCAGMKYNLEPEQPQLVNNTYLTSTNETNILTKARDIAKITQNHNEIKENTFIDDPSLIHKNHLDYVPQTESTIFQQTSNHFYGNNNSFQQNSVANNSQYINYNINKVLENDNYSVDFAVVKKISGYLNLNPGSSSNVYCNLDNKVYDENCDTIINNILDSNSVCSPISDLNNGGLIDTSHSYCTYPNSDLNPKPVSIQPVPINNSWNAYNENVLTRLENVEKSLETFTNLDPLLYKHNLLENQVPYNINSNCYAIQNANENMIRNSNVPFNETYVVDNNIYNREYTTPAINVDYSTRNINHFVMNYSDTSEEYSPTFKKDCFSFSEDSNGNEIPSRKKPKVTEKRIQITNYKENKFFSIFQDLEIASRHCDTIVEFTFSAESTQITYLVDKNKSLYSCKTCNTSYETIAQILDHTSLHKSFQDLTENVYQSINVPKPEKSVKMIVNHEVKKYVCEKCNKDFRNVSALYRHVAVHVSNQRHFCDECGKSFPVARYLSLHKLTHSRIKVYTCKLCPKTFKDKDNLKTHEADHYQASPDTPYVCDVCGKCFVSDEYLKIHMKQHNKETARICHICGKIQKSEEMCYKHIQENHLVVLQCEICNKTFGATRNLKAHMKLHGTKDFKCDQCEKEFFFKRDLDSHKFFHTGLRPFVCHYCSKDFRTRGALYKHIRTHTKVMAYVCRICQKAFSQLRSLKVHETIHSGNKPYKCHQCGKSYVQKNIFHKHMKKVHPGVVVF